MLSKTFHFIILIVACCCRWIQRCQCFGPSSIVRQFAVNTHQYTSMRSHTGSTVRMMFSGIVEDVGTVDRLTVNKAMTMWDGSVGEGVELTIKSSKAVEDAYIGCSIAVNGVCLTATHFDDSGFTVGLAPETLRRSNLGELKSGSKVNVERAMRADGRNSGHFVQGHVDGTGRLLDRWEEGDSLWMKVQLPLDLLRYVVPKGFICIDGTSLTVCDVCKDPQSARAGAGSGKCLPVEEGCGWFTIMLVAHTQQNVVFPLKFWGDKVNIEVDVLGKMVESSVAATIGSLQEELRARDAQILSLQQSVSTQESVLQKLSTQVHNLIQSQQREEK